MVLPVSAGFEVGSGAEVRVPHLPQNRSLGGTWLPQLGQMLMFITLAGAGAGAAAAREGRGELAGEAVRGPTCAPHIMHREAPMSVSASHLGQTRPTVILTDSRFP